MKKYLIGFVIIVVIVLGLKVYKNLQETTKYEPYSPPEEIVYTEAPYPNSLGFDLMKVPAGPFRFGQFNKKEVLDYDYGIMRNLVTNEQFLKFINDALVKNYVMVKDTGLVLTDKNWLKIYTLNGKGRIKYNNGKFSIEKGYENHPVVEVTCKGAEVFAEYYGMRLPTEKEWEKAARGNTGNTYPWDNEIDGSYANYLKSTDFRKPGTTPVGYYNGSTYEIGEDVGKSFMLQTKDAKSPLGCYDMCGNAYDWVVVGKNMQGTTIYGLKGGGWNFTLKFNHHKAWYTWKPSLPKTTTSPSWGFRCVLQNKQDLPKD